MSNLALTLIQQAKQTRATFLDLGNCGLTEIPPSIIELPWLISLNLGLWYYDTDKKRYGINSNSKTDNNFLPTALNVLVQLPQLKILDLNGMGINDIGVLSQLPQLQSLNLSKTGINDISVLAQLHQLRSLNLSGTRINDISVLAHLPLLHTLNLSKTGINDISVLAQLHQLQSLDLNGTDINDISMLAQLPLLHTLNLSKTGINDFSVLAQLHLLHTLNLSETNINDISVLAQLPQLQSLNLYGTGINDISVLAQLPFLHTLNLSKTGINDISVLAQLPQLQSLDLYGTGINDISVLAQLPLLHTLDLYRTDINDISVLAQLHLLHTLDIGNTGINDISVLAHLPQLKTLQLSSSVISDISVLAQLPLLHTLNLSYNTDISDINVLAQLPLLHTLNLSGTGTSDITPLLLLLHLGTEVKWSDEYWKGGGIYVEDCPFVTPPVEIIKQGTDAILNYFRQIDEQGGTVPLYEAKLIMVGEPGAGKTSLTKKLLDESHQVLADDPDKKSTLGINVEENWQFPDYKRPDELFTSHIWDFGGQEIQYMTHQFFLTPESLYVLVADDRKQHTLFPYWFEVIQLLGKDETGQNSPILVVLNERSHKSITNFDLNQYRLKYPDIQIEMLEVDLAETDLGRYRLVRDKVQQMLCTLNHVGRQLPRKWPTIRQSILAFNDTKNHISEQEFADICAQHNVTRPEDQQLISKYLHQLGVILHFQNDRQLRDFIIINPTWALKAVYAILENKEVGRNHGRFTDANLDQYWQDLTNDERVKILNLMKRDSFEICYPVNNHTYIAPQLLPTIRPAFNWNSQQSLKCQFFYRFMPKGIMTRLIVRKHESIKRADLVWARGAVFHRFECNILVTEEETERDGKVIIEVLGPANNRIRALDFIRNEIEDIHEKWFSKIEFEERAPCNCDDCLGSANPTFFSWKSLSKYVEQNIKMINCENGRIKGVPVIPLLEGIYDPKRIDSLRQARRLELRMEDGTSSDFERTYLPTERDNLATNNTAKLVYTMIPEPTIKSMNTNSNSPESPPDRKTNWLAVVGVAALIALVFFAFAKPGSKLDFFGWFKAEQGSESSESNNSETTKPAAPATTTIIGSIVVNGRNVSAENVKQVRVKDQTLVQPARLSNNRFVLREVEIPSDRLLEIAIDLKDGRSPSQLFKLPKVNAENTIDLREVLLDVKPISTSQRRTGQRNGSPTIIIKNQNIQTNQPFSLTP